MGDPNILHDQGDGRFIFFHLMPNWNFLVHLSFGFETVLSKTRREVEQRKPLIPTPLRKQNYTVTSKTVHQLIWFWLMYLEADGILLPIYTEPIRTRGHGTLQGANVIHTENTEYYYNFHNLSTHIVLIDLKNEIEPETFDIGVVSNTSIGIAPNVVGNFRKESSVVFPIYQCYLTSKKRTDITDKMTQFNLEFTEFK